MYLGRKPKTSWKSLNERDWFLSSFEKVLEYIDSNTVFKCGYSVCVFPVTVEAPPRVGLYKQDCERQLVDLWGGKNKHNLTFHQINELLFLLHWETSFVVVF